MSSDNGYCWGGYLGAVLRATTNLVIKRHASFHLSWATGTIHGL
ncbi:hypothetical protein PPTG_23013 [Phytophthora nicotianae INRA-310]|uniref:Uncharacterized protein n=1 Tax=Phytophthora nicotianae (strain INRA-310) TaxID=761204 RepID=W2Q5F7_PHYN3|nr:hypothetical protein PPTG_23013 [Phytophthora nicotianae INRA-310]ETN08418.1 hypothetical protein PPTG_23013 [Phytophthora nicotianae INRA-310]